MLSPMPAMAAAAAVTTSLRLGVQVANVALRPLGWLAHELAAVDLISGGRLEVGLGAGVAAREVQSLGLSFPSAGQRIDLVARALELLPRLFSGESITEEPGAGRLQGFRLDLVPPQGARVPLLVGGNRDRLLAVAARHADIVQFLGFTSGPGGRDYRNFTDTALGERVAHVREHAADRFDDLELSVLLQAAGVVADPAQVVRRMGVVSSGTLPEAQTLQSPYVRLGRSVDELCDRILETSERHGITYFTVYAQRCEGFETVVARLT